MWIKEAELVRIKMTYNAEICRRFKEVQAPGKTAPLKKSNSMHKVDESHLGESIANNSPEKLTIKSHKSRLPAVLAVLGFSHRILESTAALLRIEPLVNHHTPLNK